MTAPAPGETPQRRLEVVVQSALAPARSVACERRLLHDVATGRSPSVLRVFDLRGDVLSLGRYHLAPDVPAGGPTALLRRASGGRVVPAGEGFLGLALALPHRSALVGDDPFALAPEQVMNRCVRGILEGCRQAGVAAFYPGRDVITVAGRVLGLVSFEVDASGALLFEAVLASARDFGVLPGLLDAVDPQGIIPARLPGPDETTSLARELARVPTPAEVAQWCATGYAARFGHACTSRVIDDAELPALDLDAWLRERRPRPGLDRRGSTTTQLGVLDARFSVRDGRLAEVLLGGDFIAASAGIAQLEAELVGCPAEPGAIDAVVRRVFADRAHFILGIGPLTTVAETFARGLAT